VQNATMLIRLAQSRKERDAKALREALSKISGTHETSLIGLGPSGGDAVVGPERIEIDGLNRSTSVRQQRQQQQQQGGKEVAESFNFGTDLSGLCTGTLEGLITPDSLAVDWDAIFENPDWI
jgi:hypothetical protein